MSRVEWLKTYFSGMSIPSELVLPEPKLIGGKYDVKSTFSNAIASAFDVGNVFCCTETAAIPKVPLPSLLK